MVTNITNEAKAKWAEAIATKDPEKKLRLLKEFYSSFPKHKGTEKLEMSIKRQIKNLEEELEVRRSKKTGSTLNIWSIKKEDVLQIALIGRLSSAIYFFKTLTGLDVKPYQVLSNPVKGVFRSMNIRTQIVLTPIDEQIGEDKLDKLISIARNADAILVYADDNNYADKVIEYFNTRNIDIISDKLKVEIENTPHGGIRIVGNSSYINERSAVEFLQSFKIRNAIVKITSDATMDDLEDAIFGRVAKKTLFINHGYNPVKFENKEQFMEVIINRLGFIRVFTKKIGEEPEEEPLILEDGSRVYDLAKIIHKDFARNFKYARVWRDGSAVKVGKDFMLNDMDIVELHAT
ncbi:MAG: GTP-binding protein [Candidatus Nitrosocaldaceae archaeon]|nr:MAG: GTP-binding protein [Candidatus Nitrosocaldaceae archaeon]